jgi:mannose-6-phosphate isomerase-like protein (cupin superfamily)
MAFNKDIKKLAMKNKNFRKVLSTAKNSQIVVMSLRPKEDIGMEVHKDVDQILVFLSGTGEAKVGGVKSRIKKDSIVHVPMGTWHNFTNTGESTMKLFTAYSPPEHKPGTVHRTKADAVKAHEKEND